MTKYNEILLKYIPENAVTSVLNLLKTSQAQLRITRGRATKLGDYRPPVRFNFHKITVNHDLNKYHFLITLIHEIAHLKVWEEYKHNVKPHGIEWKQKFRELMMEFMSADIFPNDIVIVLQRYLKNPGSSSVDLQLTKKLREYDGQKNYLFLEDLPVHSFFSIYNGMIFEKLEKIRKRYRCKRLDNNRFYLISPIMEVIPVEK